MKKTKWGILGCAKIATGLVIPALKQSTLCEVVAIASRNEEKARSFGEKLGIASCYGSYEDLLADPEVEVIYNPLPNHLHVPWTVKALEAGKHVLCEKPFALDYAEALKMAEAAKGFSQLKVMEGFMYRFHPQWEEVVSLVRSGAIGTLETIQSAFSYYNSNDEDVRYIYKNGGGSLYDLGCYNISLSRLLFGSEPKRICGLIDRDPRFEIDRITSGMLDFGTGTATFTCSIQMVHHQRVNIFGSTGRIEIEIPFNAPADRPCRLWYQKDMDIEEKSFPVSNQFTIQGDRFAQAILEDTPAPYSLEDMVANTRAIDSLFQSAKQQCWVSLE